MKKKWIAAIGIYIGLFVICVIALYAVPSVRGMLEKTYIAEYGRIDVKDEVSAFLVRDEKVYIAKQDSDVNRLAEADKLVRANTRVVELTPTDLGDGGKGPYTGILTELGESVEKTEQGYTKTAGYISYYVDGAEAKLSTDALDDLKYEDFKALTGRKAKETPDRKCKAGYPVFKITKNGKWYLVYYLGNRAAAKYEAGDTVSVELGGEPVDVTVSSVEKGKKYSKITLSCKSFFDGFLELRNLETTVTFASAEGLVLEDASIVDSPDGKRGVFVKNKLGEHIFTPIKVKADDGAKCVVYSDIYVDEEGNYVETLGTYDEIVAEPTEEDLAKLASSGKEQENGD